MARYAFPVWLFHPLLIVALLVSFAPVALARGGGHSGGHSSGSSGHSSGSHSGSHTGRSHSGSHSSRHPSSSSGKHSSTHGSKSHSGSSGGKGHSSGRSSPSPKFKDSHARKRAPGVARDNRGKIKRSKEARAEFQQAHPCPSTGKTSGACPGYVVDHVVPLKRGGADNALNMQWQTKEAATEKDKWE